MYKVKGEVKRVGNHERAKCGGGMRIEEKGTERGGSSGCGRIARVSR